MKYPNAFVSNHVEIEQGGLRPRLGGSAHAALATILSVRYGGLWKYVWICSANRNCHIGDDADAHYFHRATQVNMARASISMDGRLEHWDKNFNMKVTNQQRQEGMFSCFKSAARRKGLLAPLIADGVWGAAHHNMHVLNTTDERTIIILNGTIPRAQKCHLDIPRLVVRGTVIIVGIIRIHFCRAERVS